jgi:hypothetical protein
MRTVKHVWILIVSFGLLLTTTATARGQQTIELGTEATVIDPLKVGVYIPTDATIQWNYIQGGQANALIQTANQAWLIQIFERRSRDLNLTPSEVLDAIVSQRAQETRIVERGARTAKATVQPFDRTDDLRAGLIEGARVYINRPDDESFPTTGYSVFRTEPGRFIIFQLDCPTASLDEVRPVYETIVATTEHIDADEIDEQRRLAILSGRKFLASLTADDLEAVLQDEPIFLRQYAPAIQGGAASDAREIGWQRITMRKGQLGELDPSKPRSRWTAPEREFGFVVEILVRTLQDPWLIDSRALFFLSNDRQREMWSVIMEMKSGDTLMKSKQTVVRRETRLTVLTEQPGKPPIEKEFNLLEGHYLSAVERYLMPRLVARKAPQTQLDYLDLGYYTFDSARDTVSLRMDTFERGPGGGWICETKPSEEQLPWTSTYDSEGSLISRQLSPTIMLERSSQERIRHLWQSKNLPVN